MNQTVVTTSWDDGHKLDLKLAQLLRQHGLEGTFYIAPEDHEIEPTQRLTNGEIQVLAQHFEIGAHTITHPRLPQVTDDAAVIEITNSKAVLEGTIGRPVTSFCYPGGEYRPIHVEAARRAGYTYARTVDRFQFAVGPDPFVAPTSIHAYRHWSDLLDIAHFARFNPIKTIRYLLNWDQLAMAMFDRTLHQGGIFHLWGHSWEIDQAGDWQRLERVFKHIAGRPGVAYQTNQELV